MRSDAQPPADCIYRPRNPQASPLYRCVRRRGEELDAAGLIQRPFFRYCRRYPGEFCRLVAALLKAGFKAMEPRARPAFILYVQTFGNLVSFNPNIHALLTDDVFLPPGRLRVLPPLPEAPLCDALRHKLHATRSRN